MKNIYKILIVEDSMTAMLYTSDIVNKIGYKVVEAINGKIALEKLQSDSFDMIISDILMPGMDGFQLLKHVKADPDLRNIPFIFHTATYNSDNDKDFGFKLGVDAYIHKFKDPAELSELIQAVFYDLEAGKFISNKPIIEQEEVVFKLYSERLINKLEKKVLDLEREVNKHNLTKKYAVLYDEYKIQNKELIKAKEQAEESSIRLEKFMNSATDHFSLFDSELNLIDLSTSSLEKFLPGRKKEEIIGKNLLYFSPDLKQSDTWDKYMQVIKTGKPYIEENYIPNPKYGDIYLSLKAFKVGDGIGVITTDVTKRKQMEKALRESETNLRALFHTMTDSIFELDYDGRYVSIAPTSPELLFKPSEEMIGKTLHEVFPKPEADKFLNFIHKCLDENKTISIDYSLIVENKTIWFEGRATPKNKNSVLFIARDITKRKQSEKVLHETNQKYESLILNNPDVFMRQALDGRMIYASPQCEKILGFTAEEIMNINILKQIHPDDFEKVKEKRLQALNGAEINNFEYRFISKSGDIIWLSHTAYPIIIDGELKELQSTFRDITIRKEVEIELSFLSIIAKQANTPTLSTDLNFKITWVNDAFKKLYGYTAKEILGKSPDILNAEPLSEEIQNEIYRTVSKGKVTNTVAINKRKNGSTFYCEFKVFPLFDGTGRIFAYSGHQTDITERKQAEEKMLESEEKYRSLTENINVGIYRNTPGKQGKFIEINNAMLKIFGYQNRKELFSKNVSDLYKDSVARAKLDEELHEKGFIENEELKLRKKDGTSIICSVSATAVKDDKGKVIHFDGIIEDITERRNTEEEIVKLSKIAETTSQFIVMTKVDGTVIYINQAYLNESGYTEKEIIGNSMFDFTADSGIKTLNEEITPTLLSSGHWQGEMSVIRKDNSLFQADLICSVINNSNNEPEYLVAVFTDITKRKEAEQALKESEAQLRESNKTKDKFFSIIAHDLRTPFNSMLGFSELLNEKFDQYDTETKKKYTGIIYNGLQKTLKLLDNLLEWSWSQKGIIDFNPEKTSLNSLVKEKLELVNQSADNKSIQIINQIAENIYVEADKNMLATIIRNLLSNAIKFTNKHGKITIKTFLVPNEKHSQFIGISVNDTGVGISKEIQSTLFNIGETISTSGTEKEEGTGLGLILCKEFVEKHGGKIWVESEVGVGSSFNFTIPLHIEDSNIL